jgi:hypothetical protein
MIDNGARIRSHDFGAAFNLVLSSRFDDSRAIDR